MNIELPDIIRIVTDQGHIYEKQSDQWYELIGEWDKQKVDISWDIEKGTFHIEYLE